MTLTPLSGLIKLHVAFIYSCSANIYLKHYLLYHINILMFTSHSQYIASKRKIELHKCKPFTIFDKKVTATETISNRSNIGNAYTYTYIFL